MTGHSEHGFKKGQITITALDIQSRVAELTAQDQYVALGSLDLSTAFDAVNVGLLIFSRAGGMFDNSYFDNSNKLSSTLF